MVLIKKHCRFFPIYFTIFDEEAKTPHFFIAIGGRRWYNVIEDRRCNMGNMIIRIMKKLDDKNRLVVPDMIMKLVNTKDFYVELYENGTILLKPIKKQ